MINRRGFLKLMGAATALSAGGIALIDTHRTFFLPPKGGWAQKLKIRRAMSYDINQDRMLWRYDASWVTLNGEHKQCDVQAEAQIDDVARMVLENAMRHDMGSPNSDQFRLALSGPFQMAYI